MEDPGQTSPTSEVNDDIEYNMIDSVVDVDAGAEQETLTSSSIIVRQSSHEGNLDNDDNAHSLRRLAIRYASHPSPWRSVSPSPTNSTRAKNNGGNEIIIRRANSLSSSSSPANDIVYNDHDGAVLLSSSLKQAARNSGEFSDNDAIIEIQISSMSDDDDLMSDDSEIQAFLFPSQMETNSPTVDLPGPRNLGGTAGDDNVDPEITCQSTDMKCKAIPSDCVDAGSTKHLDCPKQESDHQPTVSCMKDMQTVQGTTEAWETISLATIATMTVSQSRDHHKTAVEQDSAARMLQSVVRLRSLARSRLVSQERRQSAVQIQAVWRAQRDRRRFQKQKQRLRLLNAALVVQRATRSWLVRRQKMQQRSNPNMVAQKAAESETSIPKGLVALAACKSLLLFAKSAKWLWILLVRTPLPWHSVAPACDIAHAGIYSKYGSGQGGRAGSITDCGCNAVWAKVNAHSFVPADKASYSKDQSARETSPFAALHGTPTVDVPRTLPSFGCLDWGYDAGIVFDLEFHTILENFALIPSSSSMPNGRSDDDNACEFEVPWFSFRCQNQHDTACTMIGVKSALDASIIIRGETIHFHSYMLKAGETRKHLAAGHGDNIRQIEFCFKCIDGANNPPLAREIIKTAHGTHSSIGPKHALSPTTKLL